MHRTKCFDISISSSVMNKWTIKALCLSYCNIMKREMNSVKYEVTLVEVH